MAMQLTHEQHAILEQHGDKPMPVVDPVDQKLCMMQTTKFRELEAPVKFYPGEEMGVVPVERMRFRDDRH